MLTWAGLEQLKVLKGLKRLSLRGTSITLACVAKLKKVLPQLDVFR
jgi:hypothetical protein